MLLVHRFQIQNNAKENFSLDMHSDPQANKNHSVVIKMFQDHFQIV